MIAEWLSHPAFFVAILPDVGYTGIKSKIDEKAGDMMKTEIMIEKAEFPCEPATEEELLRAIEEMAIGHIYNWKVLPRMIVQISEEQIPLHSCRNMCILDNACDSCNYALDKAVLKPGIYINRDGDWLILIHPNESEVYAHLNRCAKHLKCLRLDNISHSRLDFPALEVLETLSIKRSRELSIINGLERLTKLTELALSDCDSITLLPGLGNLTRLTSLSLSHCERLRELPGLKKLTELTMLNLNDCYDLTKLSGLGNLIRLTSLNLRSCWNLTKLPGLGNLTRLTSLALTGCHGLTELPGLKKLKQLTTLEMSSYNFTKLLELENLTQLISLDMTGCENLIELPGLGNLTQLTSLELSLCRRLRKLPGLGNLTQLTALHLRACESLCALPGLENLTQLARLDLSHIENLSALPGLENLTKLDSLQIRDCENLHTLPGLGNLTQLTSLEVCRCGSLCELPGLDKLTQLTYLDLSENISLSKLPKLEKLKQLVQLDLGGCKNLHDLPDLGRLTQLRKLVLRGCKGIKILPESIRMLRSLKYLDLRYLYLKELPDWLPEISECFYTDEDHWSNGEDRAAVYLCGTTIEGVDMAIFEQPYEMVVKWFEERKVGRTQPLNEIKVVFLGDGEAGKSHTIARLMNDGGSPEPLVFDGHTTPGIVIRNKEYDLGDRKIQVHYWDFGGQEIMHSMHRIFLTGRTMYVILLNARDDTQSDRAKYWLHNVKSFAPDAPVLLVMNKIDQNESASVDERDLRSRYEKLTQVVRLSAKYFSQEEFNHRFTNVLLEEIQKTGFLDAEWPTNWTKVKNKLENMETDYIMGGDYQTLCRECKVDDNQKNLLHWFNDLGVSFCCDGEDDYTLEDYVILRPDWITNALYIILFNTLEGVRNGLIPHKSIYNLLRNACNNPEIRCTLPQARYNAGDIQYVLGIMRKFNLSFTDGHENEFIPMLCQQNSTVDVQYYHKDEDILEFNMEFDYLPNNLLHRLMVERHQELDMDNVWRSGARFQLPGTELSAVVTVDDKVLHIFIRNDGDMHLPNTYLAMLKTNVDKIVKKMGIKAPECKLVYKIHGKRAVFSYDRLLKMHARGRREEYCDDLDEDFLIADILNQAAPAASEDLNTLLNGMISVGLHLQGNKNYRGWDENGRNSVVRDSLGDNGYIVLDQNLRGTSETGKSYGELDLLIQRVPNRPWVLCEALIAEGYTHKWNDHLDKLLNEYNPHGLSTLFLLTYVDCEKSKFDSIWTKYKQHIRDDDPKNFIRMPETVSIDLHSEYEYIKIARCNYRCNAYTPTVYHIFVQMDPKSKDQ